MKEKDFNKITSTIGSFIKDSRKSNRLTQVQLSKTSKVQLSTLKNIESGSKNFTILALHKLLCALDLEWEDSVHGFRIGYNMESKSQDIAEQIKNVIDNLSFEDVRIVARLVNYIIEVKNLDLESVDKDFFEDRDVELSEIEI